MIENKFSKAGYHNNSAMKNGDMLFFKTIDIFILKRPITNEIK